MTGPFIGTIKTPLKGSNKGAYIIPPDTYTKLMELAEDIEMGRIIEDRKAEKADPVEISLDEL